MKLRVANHPVFKKRSLLPRQKNRIRRPGLVVLGIFMIFCGMGLLGVQAFSYSTHCDSTMAYVEHESTGPTYYDSATTYAQQTNDMLATENIKTPLLLQTDENWSYQDYGTDGGRTIYENGCAITSLAMIRSYHEKTTVTPPEILDWCHQEYYVAGSGTDWSIFPAFAKEYGYQFHDLQDDFQQAQTYLKNQIPVVVSVTEGEFTSRGHIMVLAAMQDGLIKVLDPADDDEKNHSYNWYTPEELQSQIIHYWTFTKTTAL